MKIPLKRLFPKKTRGLLEQWISSSSDNRFLLLEEDGKFLHSFGSWQLEEVKEVEALLPKLQWPENNASTECQRHFSYRFYPLVAERERRGFLVSHAEIPMQEPLIQKTISWFIHQTLEKRGLAAEALERCRELNLLYRLGETLGRVKKSSEVYHLLLKEAKQILGSSIGIVISFEEGSLKKWTLEGSLGTAHTTLQLMQLLSTNVEQWMDSKQSIITTLSKEQKEELTTELHSVLWAPLCTPEQSFGGILFARVEQRPIFHSGEKKNLMGLAWQAALAIENAHHHQNLEQKVQKRTQELQHHMTLLEQEILERKKAEEQIQEQKRALQRLTITDELTGLFNRRYLFREAVKEVYKASRYGHALSVAIMDIDHFKSINDTYGHDVGDLVLKEVATHCREALRKSDILCRYGGEEFVVVLPGTDLDNAFRVAERLRETIASQPIQLTESELKVTFSLGITTHQADDNDLEIMLQRADKALYEAKSSGRNRTKIG